MVEGGIGGRKLMEIHYGREVRNKIQKRIASEDLTEIQDGCASEKDIGIHF
jgi:hypothetical protein